MILLDHKGFPTPEFLEQLTKWDPTDFDGLIETLIDVWHYSSFIYVHNNACHILTGGHRGHAQILDAINRNWYCALEEDYADTKHGRHILTRGPNQQPTETRPND